MKAIGELLPSQSAIILLILNAGIQMIQCGVVGYAQIVMLLRYREGVDVFNWKDPVDQEIVSFIIMYLAAFNVGNLFCSTNTFLFMRSISNYVDETNLNRNKSSSKKSKQSAFYF